MDLIFQDINFTKISKIYNKKAIKFNNGDYTSIDEYIQDLLSAIVDVIDIKNIEYKIFVKKMLQKEYSLREEKICENFITDMAIKDNYNLLKGFTKKKLQDICRRNCIKKYSKLNKSKLIELIKFELQE
jgi:hypothetical protein